ncbi:MAG: undecaprenyl-diphosphate phosphatase, partial [Parasporobacterium sp.]|nr:undecaprenyl-diphosphate phosphatase [Parasporobacterium sp.]
NLFNFFRRLGKSEDIKDELPYKEIISTPYRRFVVLAVISTIPVGVAGFLLEDYIGAISAGLLVPGICLLITGVVLLIAELAPGGHKSMKNMSFKSALGIGIAQACAIFPGISRSGSTISASLIAGLDKNFAVKYSFILSIPAILGAALKAIWDIVKGDVAIDSGMLGTYAIGMLVAMVVGYLAIRLLLVVVKKRKFRYFSIYCFAVGVFAIVGHFVI